MIVISGIWFTNASCQEQRDEQQLCDKNNDTILVYRVSHLDTLYWCIEYLNEMAVCYFCNLPNFWQWGCWLVFPVCMILLTLINLYHNKLNCVTWRVDLSCSSCQQMCTIELTEQSIGRVTHALMNTFFQYNGTWAQNIAHSNQCIVLLLC